MRGFDVREMKEYLEREDMLADTTTRKVWEPGVYPNVSFADYIAIDAANHSVLMDLRRSPAHCLYAAQGGDCEGTQATDLGSALHAWALQRGQYGDLVAIQPEYKGEGIKARMAEWKKTNAGKVWVSAGDDEKAKAMSRKISAHPKARKLAAAPGEVEVVLIWDDDETGVRCKARVDKLIRPSLAIDIKTTRNAHPDAFERSVWDYGYHTATAFYEAGASKVMGVEIDMVHIAVENEPPHEVAVYRIEPDALQIGRKQIADWLSEYAACKKSGVWPGYGVEVESIGLPGWVYRAFPVADGF